MVKRGSSTFSAASVAKGSVVLSCTNEKNIALKAEVSRLRHHILVLSRRLYFVTLERDGLQDMVVPTMEFEEFEMWECSPPAEEEVAGEEARDEAAPSVAESKCTSVAMVERSEDEASKEVEDVAIPSVASEESEEEAAQSVAGAGVKERHSVAEEEGRRKAESDRDAQLERKMREMVRDMEKRRKEGKKRREEHTASEIVDVERVPQMAGDCNRFRMDLVERVDSVPDPLIPSYVGGLVTGRVQELEEEGGWPTLGNPSLNEIEGGEGRRGLGSSGDEDAVIVG